MEEGIADVYGDLRWNSSGTLIPGMGPSTNIFLANYTIFINCFSKKGKWNLDFNKFILKDSQNFIVMQIL